MTNAKRLWCGVLVGAVVLAAGMLPASGQDTVSPSPDADALSDFSILAVKPEGDEKDYKLVAVGDAKVDSAALKAVIRSLPDGFLGIQFSKRDFDEAAEVAECQRACNANNECRQFEYVRPTSDRPIGLCRLKRQVEVVAQGTMAPVADEIPAKPEQSAVALAGPIPAPAHEEEVPPPPQITKPLVLALPLPPRTTPVVPEQPASADGPSPAETVAEQPKTIVPPPSPPAELPPVEAVGTAVAELPVAPVEPAPAPPIVHSPTADLPDADPIPVRRETDQRRGLPLWLAAGAIAFMFAGAGVYRHSYQKRVLMRLTTRVISDGIEGRVATVENAEKPDTTLRFVVRNTAAVTAPDTRILAIADGAFA